MKVCPECGYENLNEMFYCRHCNYEFPDFDWNSVEHDIITIPMMSENRNIERNQFYKMMKKSSIKELIYLILECIVCYYGMCYGFYHNWFIYELCLGSFVLVFIYRCQFSLLFKLFNIKTTVLVNDIEFYNLRIQGFILILTTLWILTGVYPFMLYEKFIGLCYITFAGVLIPLLVGLGYFFRPNTFNEYNDYSFFNSGILMILMGSNVLFIMPYTNLFHKFPLLVNVVLLSLYFLIIFSILFPDIVNKYNKYDIRGKNSAYILYTMLGFLALFVFELILGILLGLMFF